MKIMKDFKKELLSLLEVDIPELRDNILIGAVAVNERTNTPFATFFTPDETPTRTIQRIVGVVTSFEVTIYEHKISALEKLKHRAIAAFEGKVLADRRCSFKSSSTNYDPDRDIYGVTLTFRIM